MTTKYGIKIGSRAVSYHDLLAVDFIVARIRRFGGDSAPENSSPTGDGRWIRLDEIIPRSGGGEISAKESTAMRRSIRKLHARGLLRSFELAYYGDCIKAVRADMVTQAEVDAGIAFSTAWRSAARGDSL